MQNPAQRRQQNHQVRPDRLNIQFGFEGFYFKGWLTQEPADKTLRMLLRQIYTDYQRT